MALGFSSTTTAPSTGSDGFPVHVSVPVESRPAVFAARDSPQSPVPAAALLSFPSPSCRGTECSNNRRGGAGGALDVPWLCGCPMPGGGWAAVTPSNPPTQIAGGSSTPLPSRLAHGLQFLGVSLRQRSAVGSPLACHSRSPRDWGGCPPPCAPSTLGWGLRSHQRLSTPAAPCRVFRCGT